MNLNFLSKTWILRFVLQIMKKKIKKIYNRKKKILEIKANPKISQRESKDSVFRSKASNLESTGQKNKKSYMGMQ